MKSILNICLFCVWVVLSTPSTLDTGINREVELMKLTHDQNIFLIAMTVAMEAEGESYTGKLAVAYVIMNRVNKTGRTISDVIFDPYDFSAWNTRGGRQLDLPDIDDEVWLDSNRAAAAAYYELQDDPTLGATHYLNIPLTRKIRGGSLPSWLRDMKSTKKIEKHTFFKEIK